MFQKVVDNAGRISFAGCPSHHAPGAISPDPSGSLVMEPDGHATGMFHILSGDVSEVIFKMAKELGNNTPTIIRQIKTLILNGLLDIAQGQKTSHEVLRDIVAGTPWNDVDSLDDTVTGWFSTRKCS